MKETYVGEAICPECNEQCAVYEVDEGNYEEMHGFRVWRDCLVWYSDCCQAEIDEKDLLK